MDSGARPVETVSKPADGGSDGGPDLGRLKLFISYSRADLAFADELVGGLEIDNSFDVAIDRHSIIEGEDWKKRLGALIADADTVVFLLSPASAKSEICAWEVDEAVRLTKRIVPVLVTPLGALSAPSALAALNYVQFDPLEDGRPRSFTAGVKGLVRALKSDIGWLREHTRLLARASEWAEAGRPENRLLTGDAIPEAKAWAARRPKDAPAVNPLHLDYIAESEREEAARQGEAARQLAERERLAREAEEAANRARAEAERAERSAKEAETAQADRLAALAQAETAAKETARSQRRAGRLLWGVAALMLAFFGYGLRQAYRTEVREINVFMSLAATAVDEGRHDRAMRFALQGLPEEGALRWPWSPFSTELEGRLASAPIQNRLYATLSRHDKPVTVAAYSPDGERVVTGSWDNTVRLWDARTGVALPVMKTHVGPINAASFSPDGKRVVTGSDDTTARLWDAETGKEIAVLKAHEGPVLAASFSPDGKNVVTGSSDTTARLWDAETGKEIAVLKAHAGAIWSASFSPDGKRVVTSSEDNTACLWDAGTDKAIVGDPIVLKAHAGSVRVASFSPDGKRVVTGSDDNTARLWDIESVRTNEAAERYESIVLKVHINWVRAATFSPDGSRVITGSFDKTARLWDAMTDKELTVYRAIQAKSGPHRLVLMENAL